MQHHTIQVSRTAHYHTLGRPGTDVQNLWMVCHGYGQLAKHFIRRFDVLVSEHTFIVAPDGLSRFYTEGLNDKPGSSWMTREDRFDEIEDFCNYLQQLYDLYIPRLSPNVKINLLGFSQGCATVMRWVMRDFPKAHRIILYAGLLPDDLDYSPHAEYFNPKKLIWLYGDEDPYLTESRFNWHLKFMKEQHLNFEIRQFEGGHVVKRAVLKSIQ